MGFVILVAFIFVLGLLGKRVSKGSYAVVAVAALIAAYAVYYR